MESWIDEHFLTQLEKLKIITQKGVKGPQRGEHKSWQRGEGLEFLDYRTYQPGDDLRYVDWSVYGRLEKLCVKLFHAEETQTVHILLDMSRSMQAGTPPKALRAKQIAAAISYICLSNLDKVTLTAFSAKLIDFKSPVRGKRTYPEVLAFLGDLQPDDTTDLNTCFAEYAAICKHPGIILILSDLFDPQGCHEGLKALTYRDFEIHLLQVLDHDELVWPHTGTLLLQDVETGEQKTTFVNSALVKKYQERVTAFLAEMTAFCQRYGIHHYVYDTRMAFDAFLIEYLSRGAILR
ncbi:DUF58 domain-containing protein [candidate division KSB3 bacterium]|uniref:DUF58 domain-containing protein n=1 Tax=candidate division KSB3 bacterium TaxID=2044937 RepID=A0A9D5JUJ5_9BACT|nr:DUF58 domain-containing protein [candidate division KSB3 bacterium]MBD3324276.1 DUF58 domain-containing protein [candidate division KSB3 bacterium]